MSWLMPVSSQHPTPLCIDLMCRRESGNYLNNVHEYSTIVSTVLPGKTDFGVTDFGQFVAAVTFVLSVRMQCLLEHP